MKEEPLSRRSIRKSQSISWNVWKKHWSKHVKRLAWRMTWIDASYTRSCPESAIDVSVHPMGSTKNL